MTSEYYNNMRNFAMTYHGQEYTEKHLDEVYRYALLLRDNNCHYFNNEDTIAISYLHDFVEDIHEVDLSEELSKNNIQISPNALRVIIALTDQPGKNRKERAFKTYFYIRQCSAADAFKVADRLANVQRCVDENNKLFHMYYNEGHSFKCGLWRPGLQYGFDLLEELYSEGSTWILK